MTEPLPIVREEVVQGTVTELRFKSPDGRFAVLAILPEGRSHPLVVIGDVGGLTVGEDARFRGKLERHAVHGTQLRALGYTPVLPTSPAGMRRFLASGLIPGVGPAIAERLVERFGGSTLDVIATESRRLREVPGVGKKRADAIATAVRTRRAEAESLSFLHALGLGPALCRKLYRKYGERTASVMREDPYLAAEEVAGVGFLTADRIGRAAGIAADDPRRTAGAILHVVGRAADDGHVFLPRAELAQRTEALAVPAARIREGLDALTGRGMLVEEEGRIYAPPLHRAERQLADSLAQLARPRAGRTAVVATLETRAELTGLQRDAVVASLTAGLAVLTGGPGTGKTTTLRAIVEAHERLELRTVLCAPTGRAAKRMSESTGRDAATIHRLLEWSPAKGTFARDAASPLEADLVVVDEASMLDVVLARALVTAIPRSASLVLVGDVDQLPPVGAGRVLREVIASDTAKVIRLDQVFRQAQKSAIVRSAHAILAGARPVVSPVGGTGDGDLFFVRADTPEAAIDRVLAALRRMPEKYALDARRDVQILVPMRKGRLGTEALNAALQEALNPAATGGPRTGLRAGDKVMQLRNDYEREVFNGDVGWVRRVADGITYVEFDGGLRSYDADAVDALALAYASTIHKAQGSEMAGVVLVLHGAHHVLLSRSLLYTAITRARKLVVIVGQERALDRAIRTTLDTERHSHLGARLRALL